MKVDRVWVMRREEERGGRSRVLGDDEERPLAAHAAPVPVLGVLAREELQPVRLGDERSVRGGPAAPGEVADRGEVRVGGAAQR